MTKRLLAILMTVSLLLTAVTMEVLADDAGAAHSGTCGDNLTWTLDDEGVLTISGTGEMDNYTLVTTDRPWYDPDVPVTGVVIEDGVTSIGLEAFLGARQMKSVTIPDSVTRIGSYAFGGCAITSVTVPGGVTSCNGAFQGCGSLETVVIEDGVRTIESDMFRGCSSLTSVTIPDSVTAIESGAFQGCTSLAELTIPESVTSIGDSAFYDCTQLTDIYYPGTKAQWDAVQILDDNDALRNAAKHYHYGRDHVYDDGVVTTEPTCLLAGVKTCTCTMCDETITESIPATGHTYTSVVTAPTCTVGGHTTYTCSVCGYEYVTDLTYPLGHTWDSGRVTRAATKTEDGEKTYTCSVCGETKTEAIPATGHTYTTVVTPATCTVGGHTTYTCTVCGYECIADLTYPLGHTWDSGRVTTAATATTDGVMTYTCTVCGETRTEVIPATGEDPDEKPASSPFTDVQDSSRYYYEPVLWAAENGIASGVTATTFAPLATCTRAQVITFLWRAAGSPQVRGVNPFIDVKEGTWYAQAVLWGYQNCIVNGMTENTFCPNATVTRAQFVTFLYRFAGSPKVRGLSPFADVVPGTWYYDAVVWGYQNGYVQGVGDNQFAPANGCTRGQVVTFLWRYMGK